MSNETAPYAETKVVSPSVQKSSSSEILPIIVKNPPRAGELVAIPFDLAIDDAADLDASSDPDDN